MTRLSGPNPNNKYGAIKTEYGGVLYDSKFEAKIAQELDLRVKTGEFSSVTRQVPLSLRAYGGLVCTYRIDFVALRPDGTLDYIEVKGKVLPDWRIKWRLLELQLAETEPTATMSLYVQGTPGKGLRGNVYSR